MKRTSAFLVDVILLALPAAGLAFLGAPQQQDASSRGERSRTTIKNFLRVNEQFCTGGQPTMEALTKLKAEGVKAIINLRRATEYNAGEEAAKAKELGLRYINIPVNVAEPKDEQADEFLKATADPQNRPAFIHCGSANRVGAFWMIRRVLVDGWKPEDAEAEARKIGLHSPTLIEFAHSYIQRHQKKANQSARQQLSARPTQSKSPALQGIPSNAIHAMTTSQRHLRKFGKE